ncbi:MAG TPA: 50S ribosomal protein L9 [Anaerolineales bacterium]|jgi:large subunit ribosomal protein L9
MKVLLIKDVYKLGRAGDVKRVADGYGRNFLIPQRLAVLATQGALNQAERIRGQAEVSRAQQNSELKSLAEQINGVTLTFPAKAGETGKLYGSITTQDIATALQEKTRFEVRRQQIDSQPIRDLGTFAARVRLTIDLIPEIKIVVHREGESADSAPPPVEPAEKVKRKPRVKAEKPAAAEAAKPDSEDGEADSAES